MPARRMRALADDSTFIGSLVYPEATQRGFERSSEEREKEWVARLKTISCAKAANEVRARDLALLIWVDVNGEMRARRISLDHSKVSDFIPGFLERAAR